MLDKAGRPTDEDVTFESLYRVSHNVVGIGKEKPFLMNEVVGTSSWCWLFVEDILCLVGGEFTLC